MNTETNNQEYKVRHSLAHILAMAVLDKYKNAKIAIGPVIENGFYYDIDFGEEKISDKDLKDFQKKMKKIISQNLDFSELDIPVLEIKEIYKDNPYKLELIDDLQKEDEKINIVKTGKEFIDLCKGCHVKNTSEIAIDAFILEKTAGAYWRGDEKKKMLTRIYGVAFLTKQELLEYKALKEEAEKRDHRKIGKELDLFTFSEHVGAGLPLFTDKGTALRDAIVEKIYNLQSKYGWKKVTSPHITKKELYKISGHWEKFSDELFKVKGKSNTEFVMKPMNCPHHTQIYASKARSYKDLPLKFGENGVVYRDEQAGELIGLARVRSITQDDGHAFVTPEQIKEEVKNIIEIIKSFYTSIVLLKDENYWVSLSVHDSKKPEKYMINDDGLFLKAEKILEEIATEEKLPFKKVEGEAAFYGPKLDFQFKDALGRERQLATIQIDFAMPKRFELVYTDKDGEKKNPVMIHRAVAGSLERFLSIYIEHTKGEFPFFLAPIQARVISVSEETNEYAKNIYDKLKNNFRIELDTSSNSFGKKVRNCKKEKLPYFIIVGKEDEKENKLTLESINSESNKINFKELLEIFEKEQNK